MYRIQVFDVQSTERPWRAVTVIEEQNRHFFEFSEACPANVAPWLTLSRSH